MQQLSERAARAAPDQLAFVESWTMRRDDSAERQRRALRLAAIWFAAVTAELFVIGLIYRAVMSSVATM